MLKLLMKNICNVSFIVGILCAVEAVRAAPAELIFATATATAATTKSLAMAATDTGNSNNNNMSTDTTACKHPTDMWGDPDPSIFYICDAASQTALPLRCPEGRGFFNGLGYTGCIPYEQWPACIVHESPVTQVPSSANATESQSFGCDIDRMQEPWAVADPHKFYMCPMANVEPLLLNCAVGRGFVQAEIVGCAEWPLWRRHMNCEAFY